MRRRGFRPKWVPVVAALALTVLLVFGPSASGMAGSSGAHVALTGDSVRPASSDLSVTVLFQGEVASDHTTPSTAIPTAFSGGFTTVFNWKSPDQATLVTKGVLTVLFLGATVGSTSDSLDGAAPAVNGSITLNSAFGQDQLLFEGIYQVQTTLFDLGTAIWNVTFYVWVQAPDHLTVVNIALVLIGIFEIYQIAALGSVRVARKDLGIVKPPKQGGM